MCCEWKILPWVSLFLQETKANIHVWNLSFFEESCRNNFHQTYIEVNLFFCFVFLCVCVSSAVYPMICCVFPSTGRSMFCGYDFRTRSLKVFSALVLFVTSKANRFLQIGCQHTALIWLFLQIAVKDFLISQKLFNVTASNILHWRSFVQVVFLYSLAKWHFYFMLIWCEVLAKSKRRMHETQSLSSACWAWWMHLWNWRGKLTCGSQKFNSGNSMILGSISCDINSCK